MFHKFRLELIFTLVILLSGLFQLPAVAQDFWQTLRPGQISSKARASRTLSPRSAALFQLKTNEFQNYLKAAPLRNTALAAQAGLLVIIPDPSGKKVRFNLLREQTMAPELEQKFPSIRSFTGVGMDDPHWKVRLEYGPKGVTAMIFAPNDSIYLIDPYSGMSTTEYQVYMKRDLPRDTTKKFQCLTEGKIIQERSPAAQARTAAGSCGTLRTYRTAIAASAEYTAYHSLPADTDADKKTKALAAINTAVNRLNQIFESEFSIRLQLIANNDLIIYTNASTDPFNGDASSDISTNGTNTNTVIGTANYDWGHLFGASSLSGLATMASVCGTNKARAVTGVNAPTGDPFVVDYVAHEMGHQMGANHTQYNNCNREQSTSMEPGSASTIMGYAGICSPNVQSNSDPYFHAISLQEITTYMFSGNGNSCPATSVSGNSSPVIATAQADEVIPKGTPFSLSIAATDPNSDALTYCWEQMDALGSATAQTMPPAATNTNGPMFRSRTPVSSGTRWFPTLTNVNANTSNTWEVLPTMSRTLNFRGTVRDSRSGGGCTTEDNVVVTVDGNSGPFLVTAPNTAVTWTTTGKQKIRWDVANSDQAPVSCSQVDILMSTDGGLTYPVTLASAVPNTGVANITLPSNTGTQCRVKVQGTGNIFYDISNQNFTINAASTQDYQVWADTDTKTVCGQSSTTYSIDITSIFGFSGSVTLSTSGLPVGVSASFTSSTVSAGGNTTLTLSNLSGLSSGTYSFTVNGSGTPGSRSLTLELIVTPSSLPVTLTGPVSNAAGVSWYKTAFTWGAVTSASNYDLQVATDASFSTIVLNQTGLTSPSYTNTGNLASSTQHWWRVRANNSCLTGSYGTANSFMTSVAAQTVTISSTDVPKTISSVAASVTNSTLVVPTKGTLLDVDVLSLNITHTWDEDLLIEIMHPDNTKISLFDATKCADSDNMNLGFDDESANSNSSIPCPPTSGLNYVPDQALSAFDGKVSNGTWTLVVTDRYDDDGGSLNGWSLRFSLLPIYVWNGSLSTDWNTAANWTPAGVPPSNADIEVPASLNRYPVLDQNRSIANLTLSSGARIELNGKTMTIIGSVSGTGTFRGSASSSLVISGNSGTIYFDQTTAGTTNILKDLTLSGTATTTLGNALLIAAGVAAGTVTLDGSAVLASSGNLTLKSDANGTARIAASTGSISGNITVERYIPAKATRKWVFLSSPVAQPAGQYIRNAWQQQVFITGPGSGGAVCGTTTGNGIISSDRYNANGFDVSPTASPSLFTYSASPVSGSRWTSVSNTHATTLQRGLGYRMNIRGTRGTSNANCANQLNSASPAAPSEVTLSVTGTIPIGDASIALNDYSTHRYTLIGNPYPSSIDFASFRSSNSSRIADKFWSYSPTLGANTYSHYNAGSMTNKASGWDDASSARIASGQAFFVEGLTGQTSVTFTESHKTNAAIPNNNYFRTMPDWASRIMISLKDAKMEHIDETLIRFSDGFGTADSINMYDGISFNSGTFIAGRKQNTRLAIQTRPVSVQSDTVRLSVSIVQPGNYQLDFSEHTHLAKDFKVMLIDRFLNQSRRIDFDSVYSFQVTADPASQGDDRFTLVIRRHAREALKYLGIDALRKNDDVQVQWEVTTEDNLYAYMIERSSDGKQFAPIDTLPAMDRVSYQTRDLMAPTSALWYRIITLGKPSHISQRSATVRINAVGSGGKLNLYPNPAGSVLNIYYANAPQGVYSLRILDMQGRVFMQQEGVRFQTKTITLQIGQLLAGKYLLEVTGSDGNRSIENFIHK